MASSQWHSGSFYWAIKDLRDSSEPDPTRFATELWSRISPAALAAPRYKIFMKDGADIDSLGEGTKLGPLVRLAIHGKSYSEIKCARSDRMLLLALVSAAVIQWTYKKPSELSDEVLGLMTKVVQEKLRECRVPKDWADEIEDFFLLVRTNLHRDVKYQQEFPELARKMTLEFIEMITPLYVIKDETNIDISLVTHEGLIHPSLKEWGAQLEDVFLFALQEGSRMQTLRIPPSFEWPEPDEPSYENSRHLIPRCDEAKAKTVLTVFPIFRHKQPNMIGLGYSFFPSQIACSDDAEPVGGWGHENAVSVQQEPVHQEPVQERPVSPPAPAPPSISPQVVNNTGDAVAQVPQKSKKMSFADYKNSRSGFFAKPSTTNILSKPGLKGLPEKPLHELTASGADANPSYIPSSAFGAPDKPQSFLLAQSIQKSAGFGRGAQEISQPTNIQPIGRRIFGGGFSQSQDPGAASPAMGFGVGGFRSIGGPLIFPEASKSLPPLVAANPPKPGSAFGKSSPFFSRSPAPIASVESSSGPQGFVGFQGSGAFASQVPQSYTNTAAALPVPHAETPAHQASTITQPGNSATATSPLKRKSPVDGEDEEGGSAKRLRMTPEVGAKTPSRSSRKPRSPVLGGSSKRRRISSEEAQLPAGKPSPESLYENHPTEGSHKEQGIPQPEEPEVALPRDSASDPPASTTNAVPDSPISSASAPISTAPNQSPAEQRAQSPSILGKRKQAHDDEEGVEEHSRSPKRVRTNEQEAAEPSLPAYPESPLSPLTAQILGDLYQVPPSPAESALSSLSHEFPGDSPENPISGVEHVNSPQEASPQPLSPIEENFPDSEEPDSQLDKDDDGGNDPMPPLRSFFVFRDSDGNRVPRTSVSKTDGQACIKKWKDENGTYPAGYSFSELKPKKLSKNNKGKKQPLKPKSNPWLGIFTPTVSQTLNQG